MERYRPGETLYESTSFLRQQCFAEVERDPGSFQRKGILYQSAFNQIQQQFSIVIRFLCTKASKPFLGNLLDLSDLSTRGRGVRSKECANHPSLWLHVIQQPLGTLPRSSCGRAIDHHICLQCFGLQGALGQISGGMVHHVALDWKTWCQTCRHTAYGISNGHPLRHMIWF